MAREGGKEEGKVGEEEMRREGGGKELEKVREKKRNCKRENRTERKEKTGTISHTDLTLDDIMHAASDSIQYPILNSLCS